MKNLLILMIFLVAGCKSYNGEMTVLDHLVYKNSKNETQVLVIGDYDLKAKLVRGKKLVLKISNMFEQVKIKLKINKNNPQFLIQEDENTLNIFIPKETSEQPFDLKGSITTATIEGEVQMEDQICSNSPRWDIDCRWQYEDATGRQYGPNTWCMGVPTGKREVTFQVNQEVQTINLEFLKDENVIALANGSRSTAKKVYLSYGECILD